PVLCAAIGISHPDASINPGLMNIKAAAIPTKNFKSQLEPPANTNRLRKFSRDWSSGKIESI
ncbi:MAG: hypothetical protein K2N78_01760, partial [Oscillospiraceae bacterium]|nr:hypothetical protein [Oscillospiraceae bacterium]